MDRLVMAMPVMAMPVMAMPAMAWDGGQQAIAGVGSGDSAAGQRPPGQPAAR